MKTHSLLLIGILVGTFAANSWADSPSLIVEEKSPAIQGGKLTESYGVNGKKGEFLPVLPKGTTVPCEVSMEITNTMNNQTAVKIHVYRGTSNNIENNRDLGEFFLSGIDPAPVGTHAMFLTFRITEGRFEIEVSDANNNMNLSLTRGTPTSQADLFARLIDALIPLLGGVFLLVVSKRPGAKMDEWRKKVKH